MGVLRMARGTVPAKLERALACNLRVLATARNREIVLPHFAPSIATTRSPRHGRNRLKLAALAPLAAIAGSAHAIGLGEITQQSALGAPLRVVVPIIAAPAEALSGECFKLVPTPRAADGIPEVLTGRIAFERSGTGARLVITTLRPYNDPIVRLTVQAGCETAVRREYTLLLDPPPIDTPVSTTAIAAAPAPSSAEVTPSSPGTGGTATRSAAADRPAEAVAATPPPAPSRTAPPARSAAPTSAAPPAPRPARRPPAAAAAPPPAPAPAPAPTPKLTVSTTLPGATTPGSSATAAGVSTKGQPASDAQIARQQQEIADALEAETIVLRQRVAELSAAVDRMQKEIEAAQALQAARIAAEEAAKNSPEAAMRRWLNDGWPFVAAIVALAALMAAFLAWRRRRATAEHREWLREAVRPDRSMPPRTDLRAAVAPPATTTRPGPDSRTPGTAVAVSELSHVTEEAGVYLAFNRVDRAIEVLEQHIRVAPGTLPAAWMMLLDLYRRQGRERDFRELAQQFHQRFNAQMPEWSTFPGHADGDDGIESFPHIVRQLTAAWGAPECRELLDRLLHDNRDGRRTGFSLTAYEDILFLRQLAEVLQAEPAPAMPARRAMRPPATPVAPAAAPATAAPAAPTRKPPTLDLELELDRDMLESARIARSGEPPRK